jgi:Fe-S-cluster containining protein
MNRAERRRQTKDDERRLKDGIDPESSNPGPTAAMARHMHALFETAKGEKDIDPPVRFLQAKVEATRQAMKDTQVACVKGCAHCCHVWVSTTIPEVLFIAKLIRRQADGTVIEKVRGAHQNTRAYDFATRERHPSPCPMLQQDICSIYESRPVACRFAVSANAMICQRAFRQLSGESIPTPLRYLKARGVYGIATVIALKHAQLPHHYYEFNAALTRALERDDAEGAWLSGEDVFFDVRRDPNDVAGEHTSRQLYKHAFGQI